MGPAEVQASRGAGEDEVCVRCRHDNNSSYDRKCSQCVTAGIRLVGGDCPYFLALATASAIDGTRIKVKHVYRWVEEMENDASPSGRGVSSSHAGPRSTRR